MVNSYEISKWRIEELCDGHIIPLLKMIGGETKTIALRRSEVIRYLYEKLSKGGFSDESIAAMLDIDIDYLRHVRYRTGGRFTKGLKNAVELFKNPVALLKKSDNYAYTYTIYPTIVESIVIEKLLMAGWSNRQIAMATGYGMRRIQRIAKKLRESEDE